MSLHNYTKKTKPALWTQVAHVAMERKDLESALKLQRAVMREARKAQKRSAALRNQRKAAFSGVKRGKAAARQSKRLKSRSSVMTAKMKEYRAAKGRFLLQNCHCACCGNPSRSMELHHQRGRIGSLLTDERFWLPLCSACHFWVHNNVNEARVRNLIAAPGDWNNPR